MKISVGSDERNPVTDAVVEELHRRGHELTLLGPLKDEVGHWRALRELAEIEADHLPEA